MSKVNIHESRKVKVVRAIVKLYFLGALTGSFIHIVTASHKLGGEGIEAWATPFMIDGVAIIGMIMRSHDFSDRSNRIGFRVQCVMGAFSLTMNVYAAHSLFGVLFGIAIVALFVFVEWLHDQIEARETANAVAEAEEAKRIADEAQAIADAANAWITACTHPTKCDSAEQCAKKTVAATKRSRTVASKKRKAAAEAKVLAGMLND